MGTETIEISLLNENGEEIHSEISENVFSEAYLRYGFYDSLNIQQLGEVLRSTIRTNFNMISRNAPREFGIYALNEELQITPTTYKLPYVNDSMTILRDNVTFYNVRNATTESDRVMIANNSRCFFDTDKIEHTLEYTKDTGEGLIKSLIVGRAHDSFVPGSESYVTNFQVNIRDNRIQSEWWNSTTMYVLEHTPEGTVMYRTTGATQQMSFNFATKEFRFFNNASMNTNITDMYGGLVVGENLFRVIRLTQSAKNSTVSLVYRRWKENTTDITKTITFTTDNMTVDTNMTPVLVHNTETGMLEIFMSIYLVTTGEESQRGYMLKKAVINPNDLTANATIVDIGMNKYGISNLVPSTSLAENTYTTGFYNQGNYYLPVRSVYHDGAVVSLSSSASIFFQDGIITDDFINIKDMTGFTSYGRFQKVLAHDGVRTVRVNLNTTPYSYQAPIVSGINLKTPIYKPRENILRIRYTYALPLQYAEV